MSLARRSLFFRSGAGVYPTIAAIVADAVDGGTVNHRGVVYIVDGRVIHIVHRAVVVKLSALPTSSLIALPKISVAITDPP